MAYKTTVWNGKKKIPLPFSSTTDAETVWHYTDAHGLKGIVEDHSFWASSTLSLNDTSEVEYGMGVVREAWNALDTSKDPEPLVKAIDSVVTGNGEPNVLSFDFYIVSASQSGDSLNQWQGYAGGQGYAIGIQTRTWLAPYVLGADFGIAPPTHSPGWFDVIYDPKEQMIAARAQLNFLLKDWADEFPKDESATDDSLYRQMATTLLGSLIPRLKHRAFSDEREVRFICVKHPSGVEQFRVGPRGLVPYIEVVTHKSAGFSTATRGLPLPISGVHCGPNGTRVGDLQIERTAERFLTNKGYKVPVETSSIPFRP